MKFEVLDKCEEREGLIIKKPVYLATTRIELTDEEFEALAAMATSKEWKLYPVGDWPYTDTTSRDIYLGVFYDWCKKEQGVIAHGVRAATPEHRDMMISDRKEVALTVKNVITARLNALQSSDEDESVEL